MNEVAQRQSIVCLLHVCEILAVKLNCHAHPHVLGALHDDSVLTQQIPLLERLEAEVVEHEVARVVNHRLVDVPVICHKVMILVSNALRGSVIQCLNAIQQSRRRVLLVIADDDASSELPVVRVVARLHHGTRLCCKLVQLTRLHSVLELITNFLGNEVWVHMLKTLRQRTNTLKDLVKGYRNTLAIALDYVDMLGHCDVVLYTLAIRKFVFYEEMSFTDRWLASSSFTRTPKEYGKDTFTVSVSAFASSRPVSGSMSIVDPSLRSIMLSLRNFEIPWAIRTSRSISPIRNPPSFARPSVG